MSLIEKINSNLYTKCPFCNKDFLIHSKTSEKQEERCPGCGFNQVRLLIKREHK